jgi:electron transport complex protein RnfC
MTFTFKRGIHPAEQKKQTEDMPITILQPPAQHELVFPLRQHLGAACEPIVKTGQRVLLGEKIADSDAYVCTPIHSSVSGTVVGIRPHMTVAGFFMDSIIVMNDGEFIEHPQIQPRDGYDTMSREEILAIIREAGIVGLGGAGFPAHVKLNPPQGKIIDFIIVNGCECEPYLTTDNRVMVEEAERLVLGLQIIAEKLIPGAKGVIAIEDNKPDAIAALRKSAKNDPRIEVAVVKTKYPQGSEKQLISAITKREVPSGGLPFDAGCVVNNVDTVIAIHRAVFRGRPLMRKVVTLTGAAMHNPGNYKARIGTKLSDLVEMAGGLKFSPAKIVVGGPMMGTAIFDTDVPIVKTTAGVLFLSKKEAYIPPEKNCIRCGHCVENCPIGLVPIELNMDVLNEDSAAFRKHNGLECIECGSCSYICPAKRRLSQSIRTIRRVELAKKD